jgi:hypothetical protein
MRWSRLLTLALLTTGLSACGGGGSSSTPIISTNSNFGSLDYVFFSNNSGLNVFDPVTSAISTISTTNPSYGAAVYDGTVDSTTGATSNLHISGVIYEDGGSFYFVSTAQADKLAVKQVSSYSGTVCGETLTHNYLVFTDAGSDGNCGTGDDLVYAIITSMSSTDAPISLPAQPVTVLFSDYSTPTGMLYKELGILYYANANGVSQKSLGSATSISRVAVVGDNVLLEIDNKLEVFNGTLKTLTDSGYTPTNPVNEALSDGTNFYFFDGSDLYSIPVTGGNYVHVTTVPTVTTILVRYVYDHHLVYSATDSSSGNNIATIDSVDLSLGSTKVLDTTYDPVSVSIVGYGGDYIYYATSNSSSSDQSNDIAGAIKLDGTGRQEITGAGWLGAIFSPELSLGQREFNKYIALDKFAFDGSGNITGGDISIYDTATDTVSSDQGSLPADIKGFSGFSISEEDLYGVFINTSGSIYLAHANATISNSMQQLDNTTAAVKDQPIR